jgi:SWI/SNF-related matrix-associated actin-dependent regulator of chromatin subfamily A3
MRSARKLFISLLWVDPSDAGRHTYPHKVTFHKHLSKERHAETHLLFEKDVVFTTYATAFEDTKKIPSPLSRIHWFRIVLDEGRTCVVCACLSSLTRCYAAHKIRNRKTKLFKAIQELHAHRRWCLTGTPIQNCLEDLGSLVAFLRLTELAHTSTFRTFVIAPTLAERGARFRNLQIVLGSICLRRTRENLGLPEPIAHARLIEFSIDERRQYDDLYEHYKRQVQMAVSGNGKYASTTLQSIHELRLFCNNGPRRTQNGLHGSDDEMLSYLLQLEENVCAKCSVSIFCIDQVGGRDGGMFIQPCKHLVCHSCWPQYVEKRRGKNCLLCASGHPPPDLATHINTGELSSATNGAALPYPSKLLALLDDIKHAPRNKW